MEVQDSIHLKVITNGWYLEAREWPNEHLQVCLAFYLIIGYLCYLSHRLHWQQLLMIVKWVFLHMPSEQPHSARKGAFPEVQYQLNRGSSKCVTQHINPNKDFGVYKYKPTKHLWFHLGVYRISGSLCDPPPDMFVNGSRYYISTWVRSCK